MEGGAEVWFTLSLTSVMDGVPIVQEACQAPGMVWTGAENLNPTGIPSPDSTACNKLLYKLRYPSPKKICAHISTVAQ